jgi:hypothetical protein
MRQNQVVTGGPEAKGLTVEFTYPTFLGQKQVDGVVPDGATGILINGSSDGVVIEGNRYHKTLPLFLGINQVDAQADFGNGQISKPVQASLERLLVGDMNRDRLVDETDLSLFTRAWKSKMYVFMGDFNEDGRVDDADLSLQVAHWTQAVPVAVPAVVGGTEVTLLAPKAVHVGETFQVQAVASRAKDLDLVRLYGAFPSNLLNLLAQAPGDVLDQSLPNSGFGAGRFAFGGFSLSKRLDGQGVLATWTFKALQVGSATVALADTSRVLSAGMELGSRFGSAEIQIVELPVSTQVIDKVVVLSTTHPQEDSWYPTREVNVAWELPEGSKVVRQYLGIDRSPAGKAEAPVASSSRSFAATLPEDGIWYAHVTVELANGHRLQGSVRLQVDAGDPTPFVVSVDQTDVPNTVPNAAHFSTRDNASGVLTYEVFLDGSLATTTRFSSWALPTLPPGIHTVRVVAKDLAGNIQEAEATYRLVPLIIYASPKEFVTGWYWYFYGLMLVGLGFAFIFFAKRRKKTKISTKRR